jgi:penicillin amidase
VQSTALQGNPEFAEFLHWDGLVSRESPTAALYEVWVREIRRALSARVSQQDAERYQDLPPDAMTALLANPGKDLFGAQPVVARDALLLDAMRVARQELGRRLGPDASKWAWGALHTIRFRHALDQLPGAAGLVDLGPLSRPGDGSTVDATSFNDAWEQVGGASYREILDTGDWDRSVAINTPGQSGQPGSPHYADLMPLWDRGQYFPLAYSRKSVEAVTVDRLALEP